jgi:hypothetical protein
VTLLCGRLEGRSSHERRSAVSERRTTRRRPATNRRTTRRRRTGRSATDWGTGRASPHRRSPRRRTAPGRRPRPAAPPRRRRRQAVHVQGLVAAVAPSIGVFRFHLQQLLIPIGVRIGGRPRFLHHRVYFTSPASWQTGVCDSWRLGLRVHPELGRRVGIFGPLSAATPSPG